jgi:hypothetical protein
MCYVYLFMKVVEFMAYSEEMWAECKRKCRLNNDDIALAKRLNLNPRSLIKNIPNKSEQWKAPVKVWLREIESKRNKKAAQKQKRKEQLKLQTEPQKGSGEAQ